MRERRVASVRHTRVIKLPEDRKKEILDGAMIMFAKYGYNHCSMRDIAQGLNISLGLCYRYFDSKQALFDAAMTCYVEEICLTFVDILHDEHIELSKKLDLLFQACMEETSYMHYHEFFHRPENKRFHEELALKLCEAMVPHVKAAIHQHCQIHHLHIEQEDVFVSFLLYGQIGLQAMVQMPNEAVLTTIRSYIDILLKEVCIPDM